MQNKPENTIKISQKPLRQEESKQPPVAHGSELQQKNEQYGKEKVNQTIKILENEAAEIRSNAIDVALLELQKSRNRWEFSELIDSGKMDLEKFITNYDRINQLSSQQKIDTDAYWLDQREVGFIGEKDIGSGKKIGTDNVQQCVVAIVVGKDKKEGKLVGLAHVDRFTKVESVSTELFDKFEKIDGIYLYGGRDITQTEISKSNINAVTNIVKMKIDNRKLDQAKILHDKYLGDSNTLPEVIFNPNTNEITQGLFPNKGWQTKGLRLQRRRLEDSQKENSYQALSEKTIKRNSDLRSIELETCEQPQSFKFTEEEANRCLVDYMKHYENKLKSLDYYWDTKDNGQFPNFCSTNFKPFIESAYLAAEELNLELKRSDIYSGTAMKKINDHLRRFNLHKKEQPLEKNARKEEQKSKTYYQANIKNLQQQKDQKELHKLAQGPTYKQMDFKVKEDSALSKNEKQVQQTYGTTFTRKKIVVPEQSHQKILNNLPIKDQQALNKIQEGLLKQAKDPVIISKKVTRHPLETTKQRKK